MSDYVPSDWQARAQAGDWLTAAKLSMFDQAAEYGIPLTCALIALCEATNAAAQPRTQHTSGAKRKTSRRRKT